MKVIDKEIFLKDSESLTESQKLQTLMDIDAFEFSKDFNKNFTSLRQKGYDYQILCHNDPLVKAQKMEIVPTVETFEFFPKLNKSKRDPIDNFQKQLDKIVKKWQVRIHKEVRSGSISLTDFSDNSLDVQEKGKKGQSIRYLKSRKSDRILEGYNQLESIKEVSESQ